MPKQMYRIVGALKDDSKGILTTQLHKNFYTKDPCVMCGKVMKVMHRFAVMGPGEEPNFRGQEIFCSEKHYWDYTERKTLGDGAEALMARVEREFNTALQAAGEIYNLIVTRYNEGEVVDTPLILAFNQKVDALVVKAAKRDLFREIESIQPKKS